MTVKTVQISCRLHPKIRDIVKKLALAQGMNESEYVRSLIYKELQQLSILTTNLAKAKEELQEEAK